MVSKPMGTEDAGGAAGFFDNGFGGRGGNGTAAAATAKTKQQLGSVLTYCWFTLAHRVPSHSGECSYTPVGLP